MKKHLLKTILKNTIVFVICLFITYIIFYNFVSELLTRFMSPSVSLYLGMMIFATTFLYILTISVINKRVRKIHINILGVLYFGIAIGLSFFKTISIYSGINLNPFSIIVDFKQYFNHTLLLVVTNTLLYFPLGVFMKLRVKVNNFSLFKRFVLYILIIETMQYILHRGIFDINDIILNTIGFILGVLCSDFATNLTIKRKAKSYS
jgi:glycopeptide antibiotics resistance protein